MYILLILSEATFLGLSICLSCFYADTSLGARQVTYVIVCQLTPCGQVCMALYPHKREAAETFGDGNGGSGKNPVAVFSILHH